MNGKLLAYNKLVYTVNFQNDSAFQTLAKQNGTSENYEKNEVIYKVIKILEHNGDSFINDIPIEYTGSGKLRLQRQDQDLRNLREMFLESEATLLIFHSPRRNYETNSSMRQQKRFFSI